ncbi:hypothetical protein VMCG_06879 [Cytospora schulzeri]|uniref:Uncharacterized protein n=1 Tax=Cytospora schulzeri TaxID=448051 RepID=A0A423W271_9PEZI|nr:hypothetical protein VMCG_06879 [Valsa malicola]
MMGMTEWWKALAPVLVMDRGVKMMATATPHWKLLIPVPRAAAMRLDEAAQIPGPVPDAEQLTALGQTSHAEPGGQAKESEKDHKMYVGNDTLRELLGKARTLLAAAVRPVVEDDSNDHGPNPDESVEHHTDDDDLLGE